MLQQAASPPASPCKGATGSQEDGLARELLASAGAEDDLLELPRPLAWMALLFVTVMWGAQHAVMKTVLEGGSGPDAAALNLARFALAAGCFAPWLPRHPSKRGREKLEWRGGLELSVFQFLGFALQGLGLLYTTAQRSCLLLYLNVKLVPFFACTLFGKKVPLSTWVSAAAALCGTALLMAGAESGGVPPNVGDALSLAAAAASALFILRLEKYAACTTERGLNAVTMLLVGLLCGPWLLCATALEVPSLQAVGTGAASHLAKLFDWHFLSLLYLGIATTALTSWLQTLAQRTVPAASAAVVYALDPLWGCLIAHVWLGERLGSLGMAGSCMLLAAVLGQFAVSARAGG